MSLFDFLGFGHARPPLPSTGDADAIRSILSSLDQLDRDVARYLAAFAYILGRVAYADRDVSEAESRAMERIVMEQGGLPEAQAAVVVQIAKTQNTLFGGTEDFLVTREFDRIATPEQKRTLLACLFALSSVDNSITTVEDNEIARVARELKIEHGDFIAVRARFRRHLASLKDFQPGSSDASGSSGSSSGGSL
jgi:uncharacterized tellurite resistance protein B-like protein